MQVIYTTPRLENAERVAELLDQAGVGNRVLYGPHHKKQPSWRATNYRQATDPGNWPRVMVLNNGDLPQARSVLRQAGLLAPAAYDRGNDDSAATPPSYVLAPRQPERRRRWLTPGRIRTVLILAVLVLAIMQIARTAG